MTYRTRDMSGTNTRDMSVARRGAPSRTKTDPSLDALRLASLETIARSLLERLADLPEIERRLRALEGARRATTSIR
jgi:hypothetical protein